MVTCPLLEKSLCNPYLKMFDYFCGCHCHYIKIYIVLPLEEHFWDTHRRECVYKIVHRGKGWNLTIKNNVVTLRKQERTEGATCDTPSLVYRRGKQFDEPPSSRSMASYTEIRSCFFCLFDLIVKQGVESSQWCLERGADFYQTIGRDWTLLKISHDDLIKTFDLTKS